MLVVVVMSPETGASRPFTIAASTSHGTAGQNVYYISGLSLINPQYAYHAARVTVVVLCVCMCVCMCVHSYLLPHTLADYVEGLHFSAFIYNIHYRRL